MNIHNRNISNYELKEAIVGLKYLFGDLWSDTGKVEEGMNKAWVY